MADRKKSGADLFIVDNSDSKWKVKQYLLDWADIANKLDIATGYFEIGSLLALDGQWQKLEKLRILMGDQVSMRTKRALLAGIEAAKEVLDHSIEKEKEDNDFLTGVPAIVDAINKKQIVCRIYNKAKFHAKAYITHAKKEVIGSSALVGSSNFTYPGLTTNIELNIQIRREVEILQEWYEQHWKEAHDVSEDILKVIERHIKKYTPFEVYAKSLQEFFRGHEITVGEWELMGPDNGGSHVYQRLDQYQKDGYKAIMKIARQYNGAFLCDGVGLGKTFIGLMIIERLCMFGRKRVALFVPKAARKPVWETHLKKYLPHLRGVFSNLAIFNHTDLSREGEFPEQFERITKMADAIVIDEAHHFRNPGIKGELTGKPSRYRKMFEIAEGKQLYLLTATPVNNKLIDLQHMIELFSRKDSEYFKSAPLGIHSLRGHFIKMENALKRILEEKHNSDEFTSEISLADAERILKDDSLFRALVVQRSREYVRKSQIQNDESAATFPARSEPKVVNYSIKKTYGALLDLLEKAFSKRKPLFTLAIYFPLAYYIGPDEEIDPLAEGRQKQVVSLIRTQFLKRFESSIKSFEFSCASLFFKLLAFQEINSQTKSEKARLDKWKTKYSELLDYIRIAFRTIDEEDIEMDDDLIPDEILMRVQELPRDEYNVPDMLADNYFDLDQLVDFIKELAKFKPSHDDKLAALKRILKQNKFLSQHKVLIFTEYLNTARYLKEQLIQSGISGIDEVDSMDKRDRGDIISSFAPYYNDYTSEKLTDDGFKEIRILISTDVLSEGLNLQDATLLINYDIHWNPVRLMQRIGRVDRRMNPDIEKQLLKDHPELAETRGQIYYWNFLPPDELERLLKLYNKVTHKTLRISKIFGIEGRKLLTPDDEYDALKDFTHTYEGSTTTIEEMHLEYQRLIKEIPDLEARLNNLPGKVFSGKKHPDTDTQAVFFCYALPAPDTQPSQMDAFKEVIWSEDAGHTKWYLYDVDTEKILDEPADIIDIIQCEPTTPRHRAVENKTLSEIRVKIEKHIKNTYFKKVQAPIGIKGVLKAWMELS